MSTAVDSRSGAGADLPRAGGRPGSALRRTGDWARRAPLLPALIFMIIVTQLPFVGTLIISFMNWNAYYPDDIGFAGLDNFITVLTNPNTRSAIFTTILLTASRGADQPGPGHAHRAAAGPDVPRPRRRPHDDDHAVPDRAGGGGPALEARALQPELRAVQRAAAGDLRGERAAAGLDLAAAADLGRGRAGLAVDPVHDADHPGRAAGPAAGRDRGGPDRRLLDAGRSSAT